MNTELYLILSVSISTIIFAILAVIFVKRHYNPGKNVNYLTIKSALNFSIQQLKKNPEKFQSKFINADKANTQKILHEIQNFKYITEFTYNQQNPPVFEIIADIKTKTAGKQHFLINFNYEKLVASFNSIELTNSPLPSH